eukprot:13606893-Ditylum_brightwellii.AAC.1
MKKRFKKQEDCIDENFEDISTTIEKTQKTIMTAIQSKTQISKNKSINLCKDKSDQLDGVKHAHWDSNNKYDKYMDELDNQIHDTQSQGVPLQIDSPAAMTKGHR